MGWKDVAVPVAAPRSWKDVAVPAVAAPAPAKRHRPDGRRKFEPLQRSPGFKPVERMLHIGETKAEQERMGRELDNFVTGLPEQKVNEGIAADSTLDRVGIGIKKAAKTFTAGLMRT